MKLLDRIRDRRPVDEERVLLVLELAVQPVNQHPHDAPLQDGHGLLLGLPVVAHKVAPARALALLVVLVAVGVGAGDVAHLVGLGEVVPDVVREGRLLVRPVVLPVVAAFDLLGARLPHVHHLTRPLAGLRDEESGVEDDLALGVVVWRDVQILGHGNESVGFVVPEVHEPLDGKLEVGDDGIGVEEYHVVVRLESLLENADLDPCTVSVGVVAGLDESVVIAVDQRY